MTRYLVLLLALACTKERPKDAPQADTAVFAGQPKKLRAPLPRSDTTRWADTSRHRDTVFFSRGRAIASLTILTDSTWFAIYGIPFGPIGGYTDSGTLQPSMSSWANLGNGSDTPERLVLRVKAARENGFRIHLIPAGGARSNYQTNGMFDIKKWQDRMRPFATPESRQLVADAVRDGIITSAELMDEPFNVGSGNASNAWNWPAGTNVSKAVDQQLCAFARDSIWPGIPIPLGVLQDARFGGYQQCDFIVSQYRYAKGPLKDYRDAGLAVERSTGTKVAFSINLLDGGLTTAGCPVPQTGGAGSTAGKCRMTPAQVRESGIFLGTAGCVMTAWKYEPVFMGKAENVKALKAVADSLSMIPRKSCKRKT